MELEELPESLIVIGGGPVALEQAQLFAHLGTRVTLLVRSTLARGEEPEIVERLKAALASEGVRVSERARITAVGRDEHLGSRRHGRSATARCRASPSPVRRSPALA